MVQNDTCSGVRAWKEKDSYRNPALVLCVGSPPFQNTGDGESSKEAALFLLLPSLVNLLLPMNKNDSDFYLSLFISPYLIIFDKNEYIIHYVSLWPFKHNLILLISLSPILFHHLLVLLHSQKFSVCFICCMCSVRPHFCLKSSFPLCGSPSSFLVYPYSYPPKTCLQTTPSRAPRWDRLLLRLAFLIPDCHT